MKQTRTKRIQVRCQPCHYDQILKVAKMERDRLEENKDEVAYTEMIQISFRAIEKYVSFFNEFTNFQFSSNFKTIANENPTIREMMVKKIEKLIIEKEAANG
jgi:hypothetical protein